MHLLKPVVVVLLAGAAGLECLSAAARSKPFTASESRPPRADSAMLAAVRTVLDRALSDSAIPGAIAVVGNRAGITAQYAVGHLDWAPSPAPDARTLWDLA